MEGQIQMTNPQIPNPQMPAKQNKPQAFILAIIALLLLSIAYYAYIYMQQSEHAQEIIQTFTEDINNNEYTKAYDTLRDIENQGLGSHLHRTETSLHSLLEQEFSELSSEILNENDRNLSSYQRAQSFHYFWNESGSRDVIENGIKQTTAEYVSGKIDFAQLEYFYQNMTEFGFTGDVLNESRNTAERYHESRRNIIMGEEFFAQKNYFGALEQFIKVSNEEKENYEIAQTGINNSLKALYTQAIDLSKRGQFDKAIESIKKLQTLFPANEEISKEIAALELAREEEEKKLVPFDGPVQHIFFHPLIAYPQLTFDGDLQAQGFNEWFVTIPEFQKMLDSLYKKGFILINITDLYEIKKEADKEIVVPRKLYLPEGKKPMVLSIDDLNYYRYMIKNGTVHKLILDEEGKVATYSKTPEGKEVIAYDNEIVPILDSFVDEHPDFSFRGAKGVLALTGYEGILGYRTDELDSPNYMREKEEALKVVQALKDTGWLFASHSQGHLNVREDTFEKLVRDTARWQKEVGSLIGPTDVFIYPFGASVKPEDQKHKSLREAGFKMFCSVGPNPYLKYTNDYILMDRRHIDGIALIKQADSVRDLFASEEILDTVRPPL